MKNARRRFTSCDLQNPVSHQNLNVSCASGMCLGAWLPECLLPPLAPRPPLCHHLATTVLISLSCTSVKSLLACGRSASFRRQCALLETNDREKVLAPYLRFVSCVWQTVCVYSVIICSFSSCTRSALLRVVPLMGIHCLSRWMKIQGRWSILLSKVFSRVSRARCRAIQKREIKNHHIWYIYSNVYRYSMNTYRMCLRSVARAIASKEQWHLVPQFFPFDSSEFTTSIGLELWVGAVGSGRVVYLVDRNWLRVYKRASLLIGLII